MSIVRRLRPEERWAQVCIQATLPDCMVELHDDGSSPGMYDLKIVCPDGSIGAVEITAAADGERIGLWREVRKRDLIRQEPDLDGGWLVRVLNSARARDLDMHLATLLRKLERDGHTAVRGVRGSADPLEDFAASLGIIEAVQVATDRKGSIYIMPPEGKPEKKGGYAPLTGDPLAAWLSDWTNEPGQSDNIRKLRSADAAKRYLFVLVPGFTAAPFAVVDLLFSPGAPIPTIPPDLPAGVNGVWVMSTWESGDGFRWSPGIGWKRFTKLPSPGAESEERRS